MVLPIARTRGNSRTDEKSRALAPRARPRQSDDRELPSAGVRLLSFTLSLRFRIERTKRYVFAFCVFVFSHPSILVSCARVVEPDPFISFIRSDRVLRPRVRLPRRSRAHIRENTSFSGRGVRGVASRVWDRRECTRFDWTLRDPDGWMDGSRSGRRPRLRSGDATTAGSRPW